MLRPQPLQVTDDAELTLGLRTRGEDHAIHYRARGARLGEPADALVPMLLLPAMRLRRDLRVPGHVSPRLLSGVAPVQALVHSWDRHYRPVRVVAELGPGGHGRGAGVACFFSGGVDSFYTALKHEAEITHLVFVHGFDIDLADSRRRSAAIATVREVAERMGKGVVEVETNVRAFASRYVDWNLYSGSAMAAVALLLQRDFRRVYFASTFAYRDWAEGAPRQGTHPALDPLWSTEATEMVHADADSDRIEKIRYLTEQPLAMEHLLVCYSGSGGEPYNCGRCAKCLRTMASLRLVGGLERCRTLPDELDLDALAGLPALTKEEPRFLGENLRLARESDPELARALTSALKGRPMRAAVRQWYGKSRRLGGRVKRAPRHWLVRGRRLGERARKAVRVER